MQFPFVGPAYRTRSSIFNSEDLYNMYCERGGPTSRAPLSYIGTPGLALWTTLASVSGIRGMKVFNSAYAVVVSYDQAWRVDVNANFISLGVIAPGYTPVSMATNGINMMLVTGDQGYVIDPLAGTLTQITDADFVGADTVDFCDGYYLWNQPGTGRFQISSIYGTDIDALDFATAEGAPDLLLSLLVDHREIWLFGENTTEVFFNSGNTDFPFERIPGAFIEQGCAAKFSPAKLDNSVVWLAKDERGQGTVQKANGYAPVRISTYAVEFDIAQMAKTSRIDDAIAFSYTQEGHSFYVLNFPTAGKTWVFDAAENLWHRRCYRNPITNAKEQIRAQTQMQFAGKTIVGDRTGGQLYIYDLDTYSDNGVAIPRIRITPHIVDPDNKMQFFFYLEVDIEAGVGTENGTGIDPQGVLRWSDDGGKTWSPEMRRSLGKVGEYRRRCRFPKLGKARDRVYEFTITDPVKVVIVGASTHHQVGAF